jgi:hypothetical protein
MTAQLRHAWVEGEELDVGLVGDVASINPARSRTSCGRAHPGHLDRRPRCQRRDPEPQRGHSGRRAQPKALGAQKLVILTDVAGLYASWPDTDSSSTGSGSANSRRCCRPSTPAWSPRGRPASARSVAGSPRRTSSTAPAALHAARDLHRRGSRHVRAPGRGPPMNWQDVYAAHLFVFATPQRLLVRGRGAVGLGRDGETVPRSPRGHRRERSRPTPTPRSWPPWTASSARSATSRTSSPPRRSSNWPAGSSNWPVAPEGSRVFLTNSGTEANEAAVKMAFAAPAPRGRMNRNSRTPSTGGPSARSPSRPKAAYREPFEPLLHPFTFVPVGGTSRRSTPHSATTSPPSSSRSCRVRRGCVPSIPAYLRAVRERTREAGALLVVDEVQSGAARTGACSPTRPPPSRPNIVTMAKGLGGGFPHRSSDRVRAHHEPAPARTARDHVRGQPTRRGRGARGHRRRPPAAG